MYRYSFRCELERWSISTLRLLGAVLIALQLVLSSAAFASSTQSSYSFGTSQALDQASVSVFRLVASYSGVPTGCQSSATGLGVLVGSWASSASKIINNSMLTDASLVNPNGASCEAGQLTEQLASIQIYSSTAYAGSTSNSTTRQSVQQLASIQCQSRFCTGGSIVCQVAPVEPTSQTCSGGVVLVSFQTPLPQPFIDVASANQATRVLGIELVGPSSLPPSPAQALQFLAPAPASSLSAPDNEPGMPIVNGSGQLVDMNTKVVDGPESIRTFVTDRLTPLQSAYTNALHDNWNNGIMHFYAHNLTSAQTDFRNASKPNPQFQAPSAFLRLPAFKRLGNTGSGNGTPTPSGRISSGQSTNVFGYPIPNSQLMWLVIGGVLVLVLLLGLVSLLRLVSVRRQAGHLVLGSLAFVRRLAQRRQELARYEEEQRAVDQKAAMDAARIAEQEKVERQQAQARQWQESFKANNAGVPNVLPGGNKPPVASLPPVQPALPAVNATPGPQVFPLSDPSCPNCRQSIPVGAAFCANCGYSVSPLREAKTKSMTLPVVEQQQSVPVEPPASRVSVEPPREINERPVQEAIDEDEEVPDRVGQRLGNYQLVRLLGEGGFAEVYLGEHIHLGSHAAIKVLHSQLSSGEREKFRLEARTLVQLIHPHIVRILDFGLEGKTPFLVMDYAPNGTLRQQHPKGSRLPLATIISYVRQVADALQFAHDQKLIHRDIKPENMLVGQRNEVLLSDFGIAIVAQSSRYKNVQDMAGTIAYMAPEQIQAHPRPGSDQYALGVVVYEWLCGDRPFHGAFTEIAIKHAVVPPPSLREKIPTLSPAVEEVVLRALAKDPKERFGSVLAFADALERAR